MKVLFAVNNENISESIIKKYQQEYKEIISVKNVYYFNAIIKELQRDKTYDRIVISEDLQPFSNNNYDAIDKFIFEKMDNISDEATNQAGNDIPIILICTDRRTKSEPILVKLFGIGVYNALLEKDRSITNVCELLYRPRSKKEAKVYYHIDSENVEYKAESEEDVSETDIQNILNYYRKLGKNEDRYVETFEHIATQYTDAQLRIIAKFLPLNVKAVLEANCAKYQEVISFGSAPRNAEKEQKYNNYAKNAKTSKVKEEPAKKSQSNIDLIEKNLSQNKMKDPIIIPSALNTSKMKKIQEEVVEKKQPVIQTKKIEPEDLEIDELGNFEDFDDDDMFSELPMEEVGVEEVIVPEVIEKAEEVQPKRRGRPRKVQAEPKDEEPVVKRGRGRPKKAKPEEPETININEFLGGEEVENVPVEEENEDLVNLFDLGEEESFDDEMEDNDVMLPGLDSDEEIIAQENEFEEINEFDDGKINDLDEEDDFGDIEEFDKSIEDMNLSNSIPDISEISNQQQAQIQNQPIVTSGYQSEPMKSQPIIPNYQQKSVDNTNKEVLNTDFTNILTGNKKVVAFVGTSKNGTSFLVNNIAELLSEQGINTAILDLTKNKNSYYIYTENEESLRKIAYSCIGDLKRGAAKGIQVHKNLTVYTALPGENEENEDYDKILETLIKNHSLIILDCDFETSYGYFKEAQELYLVQTLDVLTIQPLTAFLRNLKAKNLLNQEKIKIVLNKMINLRSVTEKNIIGGMAFYNDPAMSFMTELFNKDAVPYCSIPFEQQTYAKYLEGLINCKISLNGYSKEFMTILNKLGDMVYPLLNNNNKNNKGYNSNYNPNTNNNFSSSMNNTLNKMKNNY